MCLHAYAASAACTSQVPRESPVTDIAESSEGIGSLWFRGEAAHGDRALVDSAGAACPNEDDRDDRPGRACVASWTPRPRDLAAPLSPCGPSWRGRRPLPPELALRAEEQDSPTEGEGSVVLDRDLGTDRWAPPFQLSLVI